MEKNVIIEISLGEIAWNASKRNVLNRRED